MSPVQAQQQILAGAGQKYDRGVVDAFATAMGQRAQGAGA
jgi:HD-GYP domain-containing protein (c-di-GMP phosphodiesterase class II)